MERQFVAFYQDVCACKGKRGAGFRPGDGLAASTLWS